ncbi:MAG: hypothetical protein IJ530_14080 [Treponema sp.]|uniref:hypothetical protein n=1 Tax=Treponema sp. TaxID=166 RepID=UPI0025F6DAE1|nr:hypothetical protein [Treponema sp.]MBQ8680860.1 hypothetical protein [Treponema sp.]
MKLKNLFTILGSFFGVSAFFLVLIWCVNEVSWDYSIRDKLYDYKEKALIEDFEKFHWEYDFKSIASFDIKFSNGKTGHFDYAKLEDGKIVFERMSEYGGYIIYGYKIQKQTKKGYSQVGFGNLFNVASVEDVVENLSDIDKLIEEMPIITGDYPPRIYEKDFLQRLPDKVYYEDDEIKIIFFRIKQ